MYQNLAILAAFIFLYSITSVKLERTPIAGAILYTTFGLALGPMGLGFLDLSIEGEGLRTLAELTLAVLLFTDAANANLHVLKSSIRMPRRLLLAGLPLTILLGFCAAILVLPGLTLLEAAILATMLAPTDAALGKAVVTDTSVPANMRESLNVESGLNDGICVPVLFVFLALATGQQAEDSTTVLALKLVAEEIGIGVVVGVGLVLLGEWLMKQCADRGWISETWQHLTVLVLATTCFALAQSLGGSGFIASFVGGLLFGAITKSKEHGFLVSAEGAGDTLALVTWVVFGAIVVGQSVDNFSWQIVLYALLSLTVLRMLPVFLVLAGTGLGAAEKLFMGWFGPRGLASIVFSVIVFNEHLPGGGTLTMTVVCTVILSILAHGVSARPWIAVLAARAASSAGKAAGDDKTGA